MFRGHVAIWRRGRLGVAERSDIVANGMIAHARWGTYQLVPADGRPVIEHMHGRRFLTPEQRLELGYPAERPPKVHRQRRRGTERSDPDAAVRELETNQEDSAPCRTLLLVVPQAGLANRLRTILGFQLVRSCTPGAVLKVWWQPTTACPGRLDQLCKPISGVELIEEPEAKGLIRQHKGSLGPAGTDTSGLISCDQFDRTVLFQGQASIRTIINRHIEAEGANTAARGVAGMQATALAQAGAVKVSRLYSLLRPVDPISRAVDAFAKRHQLHRRIGLHVRRTDHEAMARAKGRFTSDDDFAGFIEQAVAADADVTFFLATDNRRSQVTFSELPAAAGRTVFFETITEASSSNAASADGRTRHTSLEHAWIDLLLLARCKAIHGSGESSFSICAHMLHKQRERGTGVDSLASFEPDGS